VSLGGGCDEAQSWNHTVNGGATTCEALICARLPTADTVISRPESAERVLGIHDNARALNLRGTVDSPQDYE
jgi:hypothetical protein